MRILAATQIVEDQGNTTVVGTINQKNDGITINVTYYHDKDDVLVDSDSVFHIDNQGAMALQTVLYKYLNEYASIEH